jgi:hypothetical protein
MQSRNIAIAWDTLRLTGVEQGVTNRETCSLVVSLLRLRDKRNASEAAALPGRGGCIAPKALSGNTPSTPGGENAMFSPPFFVLGIPRPIPRQVRAPSAKMAAL